MVRRYIGKELWEYQIPDGRFGTIRIKIPTGNYKEDESFARYLIRKQLNIRRLPAGTKVYASRLA